SNLTVRTLTVGTVPANPGGTLGVAGPTCIFTCLTNPGSRHPFPTRRSSDLNVDPNWTGGDICVQTGAVWSFGSGRTLTLNASVNTGSGNGCTPVTWLPPRPTPVQTETPAGSRVITTPLDVDGDLKVVADTLA